MSQSIAQRLFPSGDAVNRHLWWTDPYFGKTASRRTSASWLVGAAVVASLMPAARASRVDAVQALGLE